MEEKAPGNHRVRMRMMRMKTTSGGSALARVLVAVLVVRALCGCSLSVQADSPTDPPLEEARMLVDGSTATAFAIADPVDPVDADAKGALSAQDPPPKNANDPAPLEPLDQHFTQKVIHASSQETLEPKRHPAAECIMADFDHDGRVGSSEIHAIKTRMHEFFDRDHSGGIDTKELNKALDTDDVEATTAFQGLDRDHDSIISWQELDERWEALGAEMTVNEVSDWIRFSVQLPQYAEVFRQNSISGYTFPLLMENDGLRLREIGIESQLHRQQLAMFIKRKYLNMGRAPEPVLSSSCRLTPHGSSNSKALAHVAWQPGESSFHRFQLQRRRFGEASWKNVYTGVENEFVEILDATEETVVYRITTWNSIGRSSRELIPCVDPEGALAGSSGYDPSSSGSGAGFATRSSKKATQATITAAELYQQELQNESLFSKLKRYLWWVDDAIFLMLFIALPIRGFIYGDANLVLRILRRLPPNMPTRVMVVANLANRSVSSASVKVSWEQPLDNGVPIVSYVVKWTRMKTEEVKSVEISKPPLTTCVTIDHLRFGETYKFVVEATNSHGLTSKSSNSTYMVPVPELKGRLAPSKSVPIKERMRNQCYLCQDPALANVRSYLLASVDRLILHYCCVCDHEFCHYHKGDVHHTKALSCPVVDGRCVCLLCHEKRERERKAQDGSR